MKQSLFVLFAVLSLGVLCTAQVAVTVKSPAAGTTVGSPVGFAATASSTHPITGFVVYANNQSVYKTNSSSLSANVALNAGTYGIYIRAWDSSGAYGTSPTFSITVGTTTASSTYMNAFGAASTWELKIQASDGAIYDGYSYTTNKIMPYFANLSAIGWLLDPNKHANVQAWMEWYIRHLNWPDKYGLYGTVYDYTVSYPNGPETSLGSMDSTDSYAGTFLSLAWAAWQTGDSNLRAYVKSIDYQLDVIGGVIVLTMQSDGLTWALPDWKTKYLEDNCETYRGLRDLASLYTAMGESTKASWYAGKATMMLNGINSLWLGSVGAWAVYKDVYGNLKAPNWGTWFPDATSQLYPVIHHVISPSDPRMQTVYAKFNQAWPGWTNLSFPDQFPWVMIGYAASQYGDTWRAKAYINTVESKYMYNDFPYPWMSMENGFFLRLTQSMGL